MGNANGMRIVDLNVQIKSRKFNVWPGMVLGQVKYLGQFWLELVAGSGTLPVHC